MVNSIQNSIQNIEISWIQFNKIFIQFENVGIDHGYLDVILVDAFAETKYRFKLAADKGLIELVQLSENKQADANHEANDKTSDANV